MSYEEARQFFEDNVEASDDCVSNLEVEISDILVRGGLRVSSRAVYFFAPSHENTYHPGRSEVIRDHCEGI